LYVLRTGIPWRDLPKKFGKWRTVSRFARWTKAGIWKNIFNALLEINNNAKKINWETNQIDSTIVRVHQHATEKLSKKEADIGKNRGGLTTKIHLRVDGNGKPLAFHITPGQAHDCPPSKKLLEQVKIKQIGCGRPKCYPKAMIADQAYSALWFRNILKSKKIQAVIPTRKYQKFIPYNSALYRTRNIIERAFAFYKHSRRLATRYDKSPDIFLAFWMLASILMWLSFP